MTDRELRLRAADLLDELHEVLAELESRRRGRGEPRPPRLTVIRGGAS